MRIGELWRYPVKSMAGEPLAETLVGPLGFEGDRIVHVRRGDGSVATARTYPRLLGHRGTLDAAGEPLVDGRPWTDRTVGAEIERIIGAGARLVRHDGPERFDILPLLVATDGAIEAFGYDRRRLRPNLVVEGVAGLEERTWEGCLLSAGEVLIGLADLRRRCVMTTYDPDSLEQDPEVLRSIVRRFDGTLALNASVIRGGRLRVGDEVRLRDAGASGLGQQWTRVFNA